MENRNIRIILMQILPIALIIAVSVCARLVPHPPNVAPITGLALFSAAMIRSRWSILIPLGTMVISDAIIGFHAGMPYVYGSFLIIYLLGLTLRKHHQIVPLAAVTISSSVIFFIVTNAGVWLQGDLYEKTLSGLRDCYIAAIPFFRNTLAGDMIYTFGFFYGYLFIHSLNTQVQKGTSTISYK